MGRLISALLLASLLAIGASGAGAHAEPGPMTPQIYLPVVQTTASSARARPSCTLQVMQDEIGRGGALADDIGVIGPGQWFFYAVQVQPPTVLAMSITIDDVIVSSTLVSTTTGWQRFVPAADGAVRLALTNMFSRHLVFVTITTRICGPSA